MTDRQQLIVNNVDTAKQLILDAERWIWAHPQTGYTEWQAHDYLVEKYEALGYTLVKAGNIPGFYTDVETGKPGPKVAIFGELDALDIANHPESVNGMTHCCGHNAQSAALLGIAAALKQPHALDGLCGSIRLVVVPAEEMIQLAFREELRQKGIIKYNGGKTEFMYRGLLDGVDMAMMVHGMTKGSGVNEVGISATKENLPMQAELLIWESTRSMPLCWVSRHATTSVRHSRRKIRSASIRSSWAQTAP